jgi:integrase
VLLLAWSGLRIAEVAALTVADLVDLRSDARAAVRVVERTYRVAGRYDSDAPTSSAGVRTVPLPPSILPALRAHVRTYTTREPGALAFTTSTGGNVLGAYGQTLRRALNRIGRDDVRVHDLRHFGMIRAAQTGASLPELMRRMGHGTTAAAEVYLGTTEDHGREVAQRMSKQATSRSNVAYLPGVRRQRTDPISRSV